MSWTVKTWNGTSETVRTPTFESINFDYNRVEDSVYYRRECTTTFRFTGSDYDYFKNLLDTNYCGTLDLRLEWNGSLKYTGKLNLRKNSTWDLDKCWVELQAPPQDDITTLRSQWENKYNILQVVSLTSITSKTIVGTLESTIVDTAGTPGPTPPSPDPAPGPAASTWTLIKSEWDPGLGFLSQTFNREQITTTCSGGSPVSPGADWTLAEDNCGTSGDARFVRPVEVYLSFSDTDLQEWTIVGAEDGIKEYDNGLLYNEVLEYLASEAGFTIVSDFLNINNDDTHPANDAYTASDPAMHLLGIWQKSDIKRSQAAQNATIGETTLKEQLEFLDTLDIKYSVTGTEIRIEHVSYFDADNGEDLTSTEARAITKTSKFTFNEEETHAREQYEWMDVDPQGDEDFIGRDITYDCGDESEDALKIKAQRVSTDFQSIIANPDGYEDEGFVIVSLSLVNSLYQVNKEIGSLSGDYKLNAHLSWANIHDNYKRHERPQPTGTINGNAVTFDSVKPKKRQEDVVIYKSVDDYFNWNPGEKMKTHLGWGRVESSEYNSKTCALTLILLHD